MDRNCRNCDFFVADSNDTSRGKCHVNPPFERPDEVQMIDSVHAIRATTVIDYLHILRPDDVESWCDKWKHSPPVV